MFSLIFAVLLAHWLLAIVSLAWILATAIAIENESYFLPVVLLIGIVAVHDVFFGPDKIVYWLAAHKLHLAIAAMAYVPVGCLYSIWRWWRFCRDCWLKFDDYVRGEATNEWELKRERAACAGMSFEQFVRDAIRPRYFPELSDNKARLTSWVAYWPMSAAWYVTHDALVHFFQAVHRRMVAVYTRIRDQAFEG